MKNRHKIILVGDAEVGKTTLKKCCLGVDFDKIDRETTDGNITDKELESCILEIWDLKSNTEKPSSEFLRNIDGVILVFDIGRRNTYDNIPSWLNLISEKNAKSVPVIIVGNKMDMRKWDAKAVERSEVEKNLNIWETRYGGEIPYFEISSYHGVKTRSILSTLLEEVCKVHDETIPVAN